MTSRPPLTEEHKRRISEALKGRPKTPDHCRKVSAALTGRKRPSASWKRRVFDGKKGKSISADTRQKLSEALRGERNHFWRGGVTSENRRIRQSANYRRWRTAVFDRDRYACVICGQSGCRVNADHIKPFSTHPELRFDVGNGRTLCEPCHLATDTFGQKATRHRDSFLADLVRPARTEGAA